MRSDAPALDVRSPPSLTSLAQAVVDASSPRVAGNIHNLRYRDFWLSLNPDPFVLGVLQHGYRLPFRDDATPAAYREPNNRSALDNLPYLRTHVKSLVVDTTVEEVFSQPLCCSPLTVASRCVDGLLRLRMCIDLSRYINLLLKKEAVSLPSLDKAIKLLLPGDYQATFDLKSAFHHVLIHPDFRKYLGFCISDENGVDRFYVFRVLPFGLSTAVQLLARMTKPICVFLAGEGIRLSIYIDDGWILALLRELAAQHLRRTFEVLAQAGFIVSSSKSDTPDDVSQVKRHLGFLVDSVNMTVSATDSKLAEIAQLARDTLNAPPYSARHLAKLIGKLIALLPALGPITMVLCRLAQSELASFTDERSWSATFSLSPAASSALLLLVDSFPDFYGAPIRNESNATPLSRFVPGADDNRFVYGTQLPSTVIASDTSAHAVCSYDVLGSSGFFHQEVLSISEASFSSGHRELLAVLTALQSAASTSAFPNASSSVFWLTDSQNLVTFLTKGSSRPAIQDTVIEIFKLSRSLNIDIMPIHLGRSDYRIQVADYGSRFYDPDDWSIDSDSFESLTRFWPATIDLFAHFSNSQLPRFYSFGNAPHTSSVDAFVQDWNGEIAWCCPPVSLTIQTIRKIAASNMQAILVVPAWRSASFWSFLFPDGVHALDICVSISAFRPFLLRGRFCSNLLMQGRPAFPFLALYLRSPGCGYSGLPGSVRCPDLPFVRCSYSNDF